MGTALTSVDEFDHFNALENEPYDLDLPANPYGLINLAVNLQVVSRASAMHECSS